MNDYTDDELDYAAKELANSIREIRNMQKVTPAHADVVYLQDAAELCNVGITGNMVYSILLKQIKADMYNKMDDILKKYGWLFAIVAGSLAIVVVAAYAFTNLIGSGA
jgi:hypothetical protein